MTGMLPHSISNSGLRHADTRMQTQTHTCRRRHTQADVDISQHKRVYADTCRFTQRNADANANIHMQMQMDVARQTQSELYSVWADATSSTSRC